MSRRKFIIGSSLSPILANEVFAQDNFLPVSEEPKELLEEQDILTTDTSAKDMPMGKIGNVEISRLTAGGNLIGGFSHSRDLIYVSDLMKNYFTEQKILDTLKIYEQNGINTALLRLDDKTLKVINRYWKEYNGKIQWIAQIKPEKANFTNFCKDVDISIDNGAVGVYIQGQAGDSFVQKGDTKLLGKIIDYARDKGIIAGIGAHSIDVIIACEKEHIVPDFYMKTFHSLSYWSAKADEFHDNKWDLDPEKTKEVMKTVKVPWFAFKVLAAGAIHPKNGFDYAFNNGADFLCVGMFDFQVKEDAKIAIKMFNRNKDRARKWYG